MVENVALRVMVAEALAPVALKHGVASAPLEAALRSNAAQYPPTRIREQRPVHRLTAQANIGDL